MELGESRVWFLRKPITYIKKKLFFSSVTSNCSLAPPFHCRPHTSLTGTLAMSPIERRSIIMSPSGTLKLHSPLSASSSAAVLTLTSKVLSRVQSQRVHQGKALLPIQQPRFDWRKEPTPVSCPLSCILKS